MLVKCRQQVVNSMVYGRYIEPGFVGGLYTIYSNYIVIIVSRRVFPGWYGINDFFPHHIVQVIPTFYRHLYLEVSPIFWGYPSRRCVGFNTILWPPMNGRTWGPQTKLTRWCSPSYKFVYKP